MKIFQEPVVVSPAPPNSSDTPSGTESETPIVVTADDKAPASTPAPATQAPTKPKPCLQIPEYPEGSSSYHRVGTIEEYKILLELGTRSTWPAKFSEADYLIMEKWLGVDRYRPKQATRTCEAEPQSQAAPESSTQESSQLQSVTDTLPSVTVPAEPRPRTSRPVPQRPRGTYQ